MRYTADLRLRTRVQRQTLVARDARPTILCFLSPLSYTLCRPFGRNGRFGTDLIVVCVRRCICTAAIYPTRSKNSSTNIYGPWGCLSLTVVFRVPLLEPNFKLKFSLQTKKILDCCYSHPPTLFLHSLFNENFNNDLGLEQIVQFKYKDDHGLEQVVKAWSFRPRQA